MILLSTLLILGAAQSTPDADYYATCNQEKADHGIQSEMNICAHADYRAADREMNAQWQKTAAQMKQADKTATPDDGRPGYFAALLAGQRAWLAFRDAHCVSEGYWARGGSMQPMLVSLCLEKLTKDRTQQLRQLADYP